ncbi:MAG: TetR/AcrR family transcriptional regulator [Rhizomicrobium sp.]|nr:TetR/AcrR family transcriptional regulator [Rhizomicrobium sp.]
MLPVFGRFGFRKTTMEELADAAKLSKQGLYLHFSGKEEIFAACIEKYLTDSLAVVDAVLGGGEPLQERLIGAMDAWFGRHLETFHPQAFDVIETGTLMAPERTQYWKNAFRQRLTRAIAASREVKSSPACTAKDMAEVLFQCGLAWKESLVPRTEFRRELARAVRVCCRLEL